MVTPWNAQGFLDMSQNDSFGYWCIAFKNHLQSLKPYIIPLAANFSHQHQHYMQSLSFASYFIRPRRTSRSPYVEQNILSSLNNIFFPIIQTPLKPLFSAFDSLTFLFIGREGLYLCYASLKSKFREASFCCIFTQNNTSSFHFRC